MPEKVWLITGCSSGLGRELAEYALSKGQMVIATCRGDPHKRLADLVEKGASVASIDLAQSFEQLKAQVEHIVNEHGRIDVLVNNAGMVYIGTLEEISDEQWKAQFDIGLFGVIRLIRAVLPHMRGQKSGTIVNIGSVNGRRNYLLTSPYSASKFALESITEALNDELVDYNIKGIVIEPGSFRTDIFASGNYRRADSVLPGVYRKDLGPDFINDFHGKQPGDTKKCAKVIVDCVLQTERPLPVRLAVGPDAFRTIREMAEEQLETLKVWEKESISTNHDDVKSWAFR